MVETIWYHGKDTGKEFLWLRQRRSPLPEKIVSAWPEIDSDYRRARQ